MRALGALGLQEVLAQCHGQNEDGFPQAHDPKGPSTWI